ncbi:hypothetical protein IFM89_036415 [Coptis chinensis]|uniref:Protein kinase domain-containing protein n=1 Tax=Coptis chinensis TaxID=261450 RepID=A0A835M8A3_9MAGN|nr:hypothetical protein IFM89_036415 [Coptis chinensis]
MFSWISLQGCISQIRSCSRSLLHASWMLSSIIHCDVKSSNILLDANFNATIADFGLAKMLVKHGESDTMSRSVLLRIHSPEYTYTTKVNEKIDVYSFGVVLLELTTRKEPNDGDEHISLA